MARRIVTAREQYEMAEPFLRQATPRMAIPRLAEDDKPITEEVVKKAPVHKVVKKAPVKKAPEPSPADEIEWEQDLLPQPTSSDPTPGEVPPSGPDLDPHHFHPDFKTWMDKGQSFWPNPENGQYENSNWQDYHKGPQQANDWHKAWQEETGSQENPVQDPGFVKWMDETQTPSSWEDYHHYGTPESWHQLYQEAQAPIPAHWEDNSSLIDLLEAYQAGELNYPQASTLVNKLFSDGVMESFMYPGGIKNMKALIDNDAHYKDMLDLLDKDNLAKLTENGKYNPHTGKPVTTGITPEIIKNYYPDHNRKTIEGWIGDGDPEKQRKEVAEFLDKITDPDNKYMYNPTNAKKWRGIYEDSFGEPWQGKHKMPPTLSQLLGKYMPNQNFSPEGWDAGSMDEQRERLNKLIEQGQYGTSKLAQDNLDNLYKVHYEHFGEHHPSDNAHEFGGNADTANLHDFLMGNANYDQHKIFSTPEFKQWFAQQSPLTQEELSHQPTNAAWDYNAYLQDQADNQYGEANGDEGSVAFDPHDFTQDYLKNFPGSTFTVKNFPNPGQTKAVLENIINEDQEDGVGSYDPDAAESWYEGSTEEEPEYKNEQDYLKALQRWNQDKQKAKDLLNKWFGDPGPVQDGSTTLAEWEKDLLGINNIPNWALDDTQVKPEILNYLKGKGLGPLSHGELFDPDNSDHIKALNDVTADGWDNIKHHYQEDTGKSFADSVQKAFGPAGFKVKTEDEFFKDHVPGYQPDEKYQPSGIQQVLHGGSPAWLTADLDGKVLHPGLDAWLQSKGITPDQVKSWKWSHNGPYDKWSHPEAMGLRHEWNALTPEEKQQWTAYEQGTGSKPKGTSTEKTAEDYMPQTSAEWEQFFDLMSQHLGHPLADVAKKVWLGAGPKNWEKNFNSKISFPKVMAEWKQLHDSGQVGGKEKAPDDYQPKNDAEWEKFFGVMNNHLQSPMGDYAKESWKVGDGESWAESFTSGYYPEVMKEWKELHDSGQVNGLKSKGAPPQQPYTNEDGEILPGHPHWGEFNKYKHYMSDEDQAGFGVKQHNTYLKDPQFAKWWSGLDQETKNGYYLYPPNSGTSVGPNVTKCFEDFKKWNRANHPDNKPPLSWVQKHFDGTKQWTPEEYDEWFDSVKDSKNLPGMLEKWHNDHFGDRDVYQDKPYAQFQHDYTAMDSLAEQMSQDWYTDSAQWKLWAHTLGPNEIHKYLSDPGLANHDFENFQNSGQYDDFVKWYENQDFSVPMHKWPEYSNDYFGSYYNGYGKSKVKAEAGAAGGLGTIVNGVDPDKHNTVVASPEFKQWFKGANSGADLDDPFYKQQNEMLQDSTNPWTQGKLIQFKKFLQAHGKDVSFPDAATAYGQKLNKDSKFYKWVESQGPAQSMFYGEFPQYAIMHYDESQASGPPPLIIPDTQKVPPHLLDDDGALFPGVMAMAWDKFGKHIHKKDPGEFLKAMTGQLENPYDNWKPDDWAVVADEWDDLTPKEKNFYLQNPVPWELDGLVSVNKGKPIPVSSPAPSKPTTDKPDLPVSPYAPSEVVQGDSLTPEFQEWLWKKADKSLTPEQFIDTMNGWEPVHWQAAVEAFKKDTGAKDPVDLANSITKDLKSQLGWHENSVALKALQAQPEKAQQLLKKWAEQHPIAQKIYNKYFGYDDVFPGDVQKITDDLKHKLSAHGWDTNLHDFSNWAKQFTPQQLQWLADHHDMASSNFNDWITNYDYSNAKLYDDNSYKQPSGMPQGKTTLPEQPEGWLDFNSSDYPTFIPVGKYDNLSDEQHTYSSWLKKQFDSDKEYWAEHPEEAAKSWQEFHNSGGKTLLTPDDFVLGNVSVDSDFNKGGLTKEILQKHMPTMTVHGLNDWLGYDPDQARSEILEHLKYLQHHAEVDQNNPAWKDSIKQWVKIYDEAFNNNPSRPHFTTESITHDLKDAFPGNVISPGHLSTPENAQKFLEESLQNQYLSDDFKAKIQQVYDKYFGDGSPSSPDVPGIGSSATPTAPAREPDEYLKGLINNIRAPHTIFNDQDLAVVHSPGFQRWFKEAPENYRAVAEQFPVTALDDYLNGGKYSTVPEPDEGDVPTEYKLLHYPVANEPGGKIITPDNKAGQLPGDWSRGTYYPGYTKNPEAPKSHGRPQGHQPEPRQPDVPNQLEIPLPGGSSWETLKKYPTLRRGIDINFNRYKPGGKHHDKLSKPGAEGARHRAAASLLAEIEELVMGVPPNPSPEIGDQLDMFNGGAMLPEDDPAPFPKDSYERRDPSKWMELFSWGQKHQLSPEQMWEVARKAGSDEPEKFGTPPLSYLIAQSKRNPVPMAREVGDLIGDPTYASDFGEGGTSDLNDISRKLQRIIKNNDYTGDYDTKTRNHAQHLYNKWFGEQFLNDILADKILDYLETGGWKPGEFKHHPSEPGMGPHWTTKGEDDVDFGDTRPGDWGFPVQVEVEDPGMGEDPESSHGAQGFQHEMEITKEPSTPMRVVKLWMRHPLDPDRRINLNITPHIRYARREPIPPRKQGRAILSHSERFAREDSGDFWDDWDEVENPMDSGEDTAPSHGPQMTSEQFWALQHRYDPQKNYFYFPNNGLNPPSNAYSRPEIDWQYREPEHPKLDDSMPNDRIPQSLFRGIAINLRDPAAADLHRLVFGHSPHDEHLFDIEHSGEPNWHHPDLGHAILEYMENNRPVSHGPHPVYGMGPHWSIDPREANMFAMSEAQSGLRDPNGLYLPVRVHGGWKGLGEDPYRNGTGENFDGEFHDEGELTLLPGVKMKVHNVQVRPPRDPDGHVAFGYHDWHSVLDTPQIRHSAIAPISQNPRSAKRIISQREWLEG